MDLKKRRSSLRKYIPKDDENGASAVTPRLKRRISFSGKRLVREFHVEKEPKTWDNSYEVSDHINVEEMDGKVPEFENAANPNIQNPQKSTFSRPEELFGENCDESTQNVNDNTLKYLINKPLSNNTLCIENSVDITLFENERQYFTKPKKNVSHCNLSNSNQSNINSFSLYENEFFELPNLRCKVYGERTIDFMDDLKDLRVGKEANSTEKKIDLPQEEDILEPRSDVNQPEMTTNCSLSDSNLDSKKEIFPVKVGLNNSCKTVDEMDITIQKDMNEQSSNIFWDTKKGNMFPVKVTLPDCCTTLGEMDITTQNDLNFDKENINPANTTDVDTAKSREHLNARKLYQLKPTTSHTSYMDIDNQLTTKTNTRIAKSSEDFSRMIDSMSLSQESNENCADSQRDIDEDGLTSCPNKEIHVSQRNKGSGSTDMDEDISPIKTPITRHMTSTKKLLDNCGPPKLVVRKICTPLMSHSKNIVGLEARLLERYHNKQGKEPTPDKCTNHVSTTIDAAVKPKGLDNSLNFSISNTKNMSLSSESSSSLLIPSEYKTYNLKQLNDDIEGGKIQLFSKTPTTDGKTKYSNLENRKFNKNRKTLFFDDNIDMDATTSEEKIDIFESNACRFTVNQNISANPRISLYEDKFLDNTSFLTNAKLDDTASRNNTKRELYNMHDIDMFEETQREAAKQLEKTSYDQNNAEIESFFPYHKLAEIHDNVNITEFCTEDTNQNHEPLHTIVCNNDILDNRETEKIYNDVESDAKKIVQIRVDEENFQPQKAQYDSKSITKPSNERKTIFGSFDMDIEYTDSAVFQKITENEISCYYGVGQKTHNAIYISQLDPSDKLRPKIDMENQKLSRQTIYCVNDMELENYEGDTNLETKRSYGGVQNDNLFLEPDDMVLEKSINRSHVIEEPGTKKTLEREFETSTTTCLNDDTKGPLEICEQNTCSNLIDKATSSENYSRNQKKTRRTRILNESIDFEPSENGRLVANKTLAERYTKNITDTRILDESINVIFHEKDANENANSRTKGDNMVHNDIMNEMSANNELDVSDNVEKSLDKKSICCRPAHLKIIPKNDYVNESIMEYHGMDLDNSINILVGNIGPNDGEPKENTYTHNICNLDKDFSELRREEEGPHNATNISEKELHPKKIYTCNEECEDNGELLINEVEDITSPEAVIKESACGKRVLVKCYVTPKVLPLKLRKIPPEPQSDDVVPMTPQHHSITEFLAYEQTANSSIHNECTHKRLPIHLTPLSSNAKKRQTVLFTEGENDSEQRNYNAKFNESINDSHKDLNIHHIKESSPPLYGDDSVEMLTSDIMKSGDMKDDVENTSESIQEIRKAAFNRRTKSNMKFLEPIHSGETYKCTESFIFDGKSISIHDISECFSSNKKSVGESLDVHKEICLETMKGINFQNCYINLTCDNTLANIDQTTFSLVKTISDDDDDDNEFEEKTIERSKDYKSNSFTKVNVTNTCRKCKNCQQSIQSESVDIVDDTFHLPKMQPIPTLDLNRLKRLRCRPHILDVNSLWQRVSLDRTVVNTNDLSTSDSQIECSIIIEPIKRYVMSNKIKKKHLNVPYVDAVVERKSAASRICELSRQKFSRWIIDRQLEEKCILMFAHRKLVTLAIMFTYEELDPFGMEIQLKTVEVTKNMVPRETWKPIDFVLEFHLKLCLPFNLLTFCGKGNENGIMEIMQKIDTICNQIINLGVRLQQIVYTHGASIIRDQHRTYVYKVVRRIVSRSHQYPLVEKIEFKIELLNLKKLSYKDITMPSLHKFSESIHSLPNGVEFLNIFLNNPLMYLNMNE